jgi:hypothetical protein
LPEVIVDDVSIIEGNSGYKSIYFTSRFLSGSHSENVTIAYATADGTAKAGGEFLNRRMDSWGCHRAKETGSIRVNVIGDSIIEDNENFSCVCSLPSRDC